MLNIISQNFKNVLKNKIKILISPILYKTVDFIVENLFASTNENTYFYMLSTIQQFVKDLVKSTIIITFEEIDNTFKNSIVRTNKYYINKSNVKRTLITIVGEITFSRTYYKSKHSNKKFFFLDESLKVPKYDHYDPTIKAIAIDNAVHTSQAQSARTTSAFIGGFRYFIDDSAID